MKIIISILILLICVSPASAWLDGWNCRREIIINYSMVDVAVSNFPVMVSITQLGLNINGNDIRITDAGDNQVAREIEYYNATSGELVFFFNGTSISNTANTSFRIYYGNSTATEPIPDSVYGSQGVWDSNFKAVYLMNNGTIMTDSTGNALHGTSYGSPISVGAEYGKGIEFFGTNEYYTLPATTGLDAAGTMVSILKTDDITSNDYVWVDYQDGYNEKRLMFSGGDIHHKGYDNAAYQYIFSKPIAVNTWYTTILSYEDNNVIFRNNDYTDTDSSCAIDAYTHHVYLGYYPATGTKFNGILDFISFSNIVRSTNYITTVYNNFNNPTATGTTPFFIVFGVEETGNIIPPTPTNLDNTTGFFWVNHTWEAGTGNVTDSYNISHNSIWYNGTINAYYNSGDIGAGVWSNITVYAYNNSNTLSINNVSQNIQAPASNPAPTPLNLGYTKGLYCVNWSWSAGVGTTTSYNVSHNNIWYNNTTNTFYNSGMLGSNVDSCIIIYGYNDYQISDGYISNCISTKQDYNISIGRMNDADIQSFYYPFMYMLLIMFMLGIVIYAGSR